MAQKYDAIRELDDEVAGIMRFPEMSIANYVMPPPFMETIVPKMEHIRNIMITPVKVANRNNRIRVKNIRTGVSFEFCAMINAARFVGTTRDDITNGEKMVSIGPTFYTLFQHSLCI